jgi:thiosulfate/3-mercaptopyruvate sulfurtransferase
MTSTYTNLITASQLMALQAGGAPLAVFDCSFDLTDPAAADVMFAGQRIASARQAHLERDLSAQPPAPAVNGGRHPLPQREHFANWLARAGFASDMQAVVYDRNGSKFCGRLWWMLKWLGHDAVAVLDGGLQAWQAAGGAVESGPARAASAAATPFKAGTELRRLMRTSDVAAGLGSPAQTLIDARDGPRYRGDQEPLDAAAGHIPGALNRSVADNYGPDGRFKLPAQLRVEFSQLLAGRDPASVAHYCGSGVSAVSNLIAMELAGFAPVALYAGSWSEWSSTPGLPVERG